MTDARIRVPDVTEAEDLLEWLRGERGLPGPVQAVPAAPRDGELGGAIEVLTVALGAGGAGAALARGLVAWLQTRRAHVTVTVETDSGSVTVDTRLDSADALSVLRRVLDEGSARQD